MNVTRCLSDPNGDVVKQKSMAMSQVC